MLRTCVGVFVMGRALVLLAMPLVCLGLCVHRMLLGIQAVAPV